MDPCSLLWFRQDLRVRDNPALLEACALGNVLPIYILENITPSLFRVGDASKIYLHYSLSSLNRSLLNFLNVYQGNPEEIICKIVARYNIKNIFWNRCYEPWVLESDSAIEEKLKKLGAICHKHNASYLWDPEEIKKEDGGYYKIFGAYKRKVLNCKVRNFSPKPSNLPLVKDEDNKITISELGLLPQHAWKNKIEQFWDFGEDSAQKKLDIFWSQKLSGYKKGRDYPSSRQTSFLSPSLHFGEISPHQIWFYIQKTYEPGNEDSQHFLSEVIWREFSCYLMYHFNSLHEKNFQTKFDRFPWADNNFFWNAWKTGMTGYPIVDAGMRELWHTGYMHNRVRMIVASFLVKNLKIHWHRGRNWFWNCLVDADLANNSASWQWVAGSGVDPVPYFRIFNPVTQGKRFDPDGVYTKEFVPELKKLPNQHLFAPWETPEAILNQAGIVLGRDYPKPIIDLKKSRQEALSAYDFIK